MQGSAQCHHCTSSDCRRNGSYKGVQRYVCKACGRSFTSRGPRFPESVRRQAVDMYLNSVGIRKIARFLGASPAGVLKWLRAAAERLRAETLEAADSLQDGLPDVIEMDEIYTFVQKKGGGPSYGLLIAGGKARLLRLPSERESARR